MKQLESIMTKLENIVRKLLHPIEVFWIWLKQTLYPYRYIIYVADVILIIILVVKIICNI